MHNVTIPVPQGKVKEEIDTLLMLVRQKREEIGELFVIVDAIRKLCKHEYPKGCSECSKCRYDND